MDERRSTDQVLEALEELLAVARANITSWVSVMERVEQIRSRRAAGASYHDMQVDADSPRLIEVVTGNQERLAGAAAHFRRALARELHAEGLSVAEIARTFGVTRQRASILLKAGDDATAVDADEGDSADRTASTPDEPRGD